MIVVRDILAGVGAAALSFLAWGLISWLRGDKP